MLNKIYTTAFILLFSGNLFAQAAATPQARPAGTPTGSALEQLLLNSLNRPTSDAQANAQRCDKFSLEYREQMEKYNGYCSQSSGGSDTSTDCASVIERCTEEIATLADGTREARGSAESMRTLQSISQSAMQSGGFTSMLGAFGSAYANPERLLSSVQGSCPRMGSRDYNTAYREIKNDLNDTKKKISEEKKEILKKQADLDKDQQEISKDTTKAKEKYEKTKLDMEQERQKQADTHFENTQKTQKVLGELETRSLRLNLEYQKVLQDEASTTMQYLAYAEKNITASCKAQVQKQRNELFPVSNNGKHQSSFKMIQNGKEKNETLQNLFNSCYAAQDQKLKFDLQEKKNKKLEVKDAIEKMESEKQRLTEAVANAEDSLKKLNELGDKKLAQNEQSYMDEINNLQQRLQTAAAKFEREQQRATQELYQLNSDLQTSQVELAGLGPRPDGDSESVGLNTARRAYSRSKDAAVQFANAGCCDGPSRDSLICKTGLSGGGVSGGVSGIGL